MRRALKISAVVASLVLLVALLWARAALRASLPELDGTIAIPGLTREVTIERDDRGVPRILAADALDAIRALGFLHGQERFFQMDLLRRRAAGELAALFGEAALGADRRVRVHRLRARAERTVALADEVYARELAAYAQGVNSGLQRIGRPPEYLALRARPVPWRPEDSVLAVLAMYLNLQDENGVIDSWRGIMRDTLPAPVVEFLLPRGSEWDAPLVGGPFETPAIPGPRSWDLRGAAAAAAAPRPTGGLVAAEPLRLVGSNSWAVAGSHTADGRALLANDMHLEHGLPNIWYRASIHWSAADGTRRRVAGVTLPGTTGVVAGSSDSLAWGFTNSQGDWSDLIELEFVEGSDRWYLTPAGAREIETFEETIEVAGGEARSLTVRETIWGPLVDTDHRGTLRAVRWIAHDPDSVHPSPVKLAEADTLEQAFRVMHASGIPAQNFVAAAADGRIGWTIAGPVPQRAGYDGRFPVSWADGKRAWVGRLEHDEIPRILDPPAGRLWTANNRTVDGADLAKLGDGGYALGARAGQIRDGLFAVEQATPENMLELQLDDRARFLERWKDLLLAVLRERSSAGSGAVAPGPSGSTPAAARTRAVAALDELRRQVETTWTGRASTDSVAYRMVRAWRRMVAERVFRPLTAPCREADEGFDYLLFARYEGPLWRILEERPDHLLDPAYAGWDGLLLAAAEDVLDSFLTDRVRTLDRFTWGDRNRIPMRHPMSPSLPGFIARRLDIPAEPLPGDRWMPRVQAPEYGASERFVVAPGNEAEGLFHMPGGQSGHPLSPYYRAGHRAWAEGTPAPFLPGKTRHRLLLKPAS